MPLGAERHELLRRTLSLQEQLDERGRQLADRGRQLDEARAEIEAGQGVVSEARELRERFTCSICYTNQVDALLVGCGHLLCHTCTAQCRGQCPFCRTDFSQVARFYPG